MVREVGSLRLYSERMAAGIVETLPVRFLSLGKQRNSTIRLTREQSAKAFGAHSSPTLHVRSSGEGINFLLLEVDHIELPMRCVRHSRSTVAELGFLGEV